MMPNNTVRANGEAMPKSRPRRNTSLLPDEFPETYCAKGEGTCLEPFVMDGTKLLFSRDEHYKPGDLVCLHFRPEVVKPGEHQLLIKKLVLAPPHRFWKDPSCNAGSTIKPVVIVEMLNPRKMLYINPDALLGIHKCLGPVPEGVGTYKVTEEEIRAERAKIAASASMPVTRRGAMAFVASGAAASIAAPAITEAEPEHPWEKARRIAEELSEALAEGDGVYSGPGGKWNASVYPAGTRDYPIGFGNIRAHEWPRQRVTLPCQKVIEAHREAREELDAASNATDSVALGHEPSKAAKRRWRRAIQTEEDALVAVCAFRPYGAADARAKAAHLTPYVQWGEIEERHIVALINSTVQS